MIIMSAVEEFKRTCNEVANQDTENNCSANQGRLLPHIISSRMEHPALNEFLEHLVKSGQVGRVFVCLFLMKKFSNTHVHMNVSENSNLC